MSGNTFITEIMTLQRSTEFSLKGSTVYWARFLICPIDIFKYNNINKVSRKLIVTVLNRVFGYHTKSQKNRNSYFLITQHVIRAVLLSAIRSVTKYREKVEQENIRPQQDSGRHLKCSWRMTEVTMKETVFKKMSSWQGLRDNVWFSLFFI